MEKWVEPEDYSSVKDESLITGSEDYSGLVDNEDIMPVGEAQLIILMRIYDVQMALLAAEYPERAAALLEKHQQGKILGPLPSISLD